MSESQLNLVPETPIAELPARERLGTLISRYRIQAGKSTADVAEALGLTETIIIEVERHMATLPAGALQRLAADLNVLYPPLLDAARDWHRAVWKESGKTGGVQLADMTTATLSLHHEATSLELELIAASDELVFAANVLREASIRAEEAAVRAREALAARGVEVPGTEPMDGPEEVECVGSVHGAKPKKIRRGKDLCIVCTSDSGERLYFCSRRCAKEAFPGAP